jgi:hypothetical protein
MGDSMSIEYDGLKRKLDLYMNINADYVRFMNYGYQRDPEYWSQLLEDWKEHMHPSKSKEKWEQLELKLEYKK